MSAAERASEASIEEQANKLAVRASEPRGHSLVCSLIWSHHSFACSTLFTSLTCSATVVCLLAHSFAPELVRQLNIYVQFSRCSESGLYSFRETFFGRLNQKSLNSCYCCCCFKFCFCIRILILCATNDLQMKC